MNKNNIMFSPESEASLIGSILLNPSIINELEEFKADYFYSEMYRGIYNTTLELEREGIAVTREDLVKRIILKNCRNGQETEEKIANHLKQCLNAGMLSFNPNGIAKYIKNLAIKRNFIKACRDCICEAEESTDVNSPNLLIDSAEEKLFNLAMHGHSEKQVMSLSSLVDDALSKAELRYSDKNKAAGITSGIMALDNITNGFHKSDLIILAGRPAMGKTALAINMAYSAARALNKSKGSVLFFSLEMSSEQLTNRIMAMTTGVNAFKIRSGKFSQKDYDEMVKWGKEEVGKVPLYIDDSPNITISLIRTRARKYIRSKNLSIIYIDYLQLIETTNLNRNFNRTNEISIITRELKQLAKELNVPIVVLSQLSRAVETRDNKKPVLSDLRESGSIEQDADIVMFIYREEYYERRSMPKGGTEKHDKWVGKMDAVSNTAEVIIAKHRNGPIADVPMYFDSSTTLFKDIS